VSYVGMLEPWKGFHYLVDAFNSLDLPESELILWAGTGSRAVSEYFHRKMQQNPRIQLRPVVVRNSYGEVYGKSSVLVHPSLSDGFGYVVGEAMASGIPVIVTENTGAADLVVDGKNGYIVPVRDAEAIRERLAHLAAHPAVLKEMGRQARETMRSRNDDDWRTYATELDRLAS
jgi:glycosyltransferase involved in cell wall biosynthesis